MDIQFYEDVFPKKKLYDLFANHLTEGYSAVDRLKIIRRFNDTRIILRADSPKSINNLVTKIHFNKLFNTKDSLVEIFKTTQCLNEFHSIIISLQKKEYKDLENKIKTITPELIAAFNIIDIDIKSVLKNGVLDFTCEEYSKLLRLSTKLKLTHSVINENIDINSLRNEKEIMETLKLGYKLFANEMKNIVSLPSIWFVKEDLFKLMLMSVKEEEVPLKYRKVLKDLKDSGKKNELIDRVVKKLKLNNVSGEEFAKFETIFLNVQSMMENRVYYLYKKGEFEHIHELVELSREFFPLSEADELMVCIMHNSNALGESQLDGVIGISIGGPYSLVQPVHELMHAVACDYKEGIRSFGDGGTYFYECLTQYLAEVLLKNDFEHPIKKINKQYIGYDFDIYRGFFSAFEDELKYDYLIGNSNGFNYLKTTKLVGESEFRKLLQLSDRYNYLNSYICKYFDKEEFLDNYEAIYAKEPNIEVKNLFAEYHSMTETINTLTRVAIEKKNRIKR